MIADAQKEEKKWQEKILAAHAEKLDEGKK
jgi:hypothetical protein